jgi:hypothetical protein
MARTTSLVVNVGFISGCRKLLAVKVGTSILLACLPCQPTCLVGLPCFAEMDFL